MYICIYVYIVPKQWNTIQHLKVIDNWHTVAWIWALLVTQMVKNPSVMWETWVLSLGLEDPLEKGTATHFSILAWRIRWMGNLACPSPWGRKEPDTTEQLWLTKLTWIGKLFFFFEWVNADERMLLSILYVNMYRKLLKKKKKSKLWWERAHQLLPGYEEKDWDLGRDYQGV